ncbi:MAG: hypothetical protein SF123_09300 [Chloroflexota bacterium]|nr:hypothetical protein [Chloroflexota bacterium]
MTITRYVRAFVKALSLTLQGKTISQPPLKQPRIHAWARETVQKVAAISAAADANGLNAEQRKTLTLTIDKREMALETALQAIRHHAGAEYPYLLKHYNQYSLMTLQATNLNDQYLALRLSEWDALPAPVRALLGQLHAHLQALPPEEPVGDT